MDKTFLNKYPFAEFAKATVQHIPKDAQVGYSFDGDKVTQITLSYAPTDADAAAIVAILEGKQKYAQSGEIAAANDETPANESYVRLESDSRGPLPILMTQEEFDQRLKKSNSDLVDQLQRQGRI